MIRHLLPRTCPTLLSLFVLLCINPPLTLSAETLTISADKQFNFAQHLFDTYQFQNAAAEFDRFALFFPEDARHRKALFNAGHALLKAENIAGALQRFKQLAAKEPLDEVAVDAYFMLSECYLRLNDADQALMQLRNLTLMSHAPQIVDTAYLKMGWIQIQHMDWQGAQRTLSNISAEGRQRHNIDRLEQELQSVPSLPHKSPTLAGALSILPGAGQLYCGRYEDALAALLVNGGLIWAAVDSFGNELNGLGSIITLVGLGFYMGNIYGAVSDAHKYNLKKKQSFIQNLGQHLVIGFSLDPEDGGAQGRLADHRSSGRLTLSFNYQF